MSFPMVFLNCNLDTGWKSYGIENMGISRGTGISRAPGNSRDSGIPEAQTFPARFPGNGNFPGISRPWFPVEHHWHGPMVCHRDVQWETMGGKFLRNSRFPGNGREKFEPREFPSYGNFPWLGKFPCHGKFPYSRGYNFLTWYLNYNLKNSLEIL